MALMNMVSSNINQWTVLAAMIPLVYGYSSLGHHGGWLGFQLDGGQRPAHQLTPLRTALAAGRFGLWLGEFLQPSLREAVAIAYGIWMVILTIEFAVGRKALLAPRYF